HGANASDLRVYNYRRVGRELAPGEVVTVWADPTIQAAVQADDAASLVPPGAFSIGPPQRGELVNGVALPELSAYVLRFPNSAYGTTHAVRATVAAVTSFRASSSYAGELRIGAMSRQRGGPMGGHASHQSGRDLDIRLPLRAELPQRLHPKAHRVDWLATWRLVQAFIETGAVSRIFLDYKRQGRLLRAARAAGVSEAELERVLQYPRGWGADAGVVRHSSGHKGHLHVRFGCADYETECVE
ncbi:MAG: penicillin-insensitive murein endopeptidase, partial [Myxococcales bacterium]|nr:penicillin-insensitive murein endopeptidase [Myxococcales bacterium]